MSIPKTAMLSTIPGQGWTLHLPAAALRRTGKRTTTIRMGALRVPQRAILNSRSPAPEALATRVKLSTSQGNLAVGPIIGILTVKRGTGFKGNKLNFADIIQTAKQLGALVYVFTVEDIDWDTKSTSAYLYQENTNQWVRFASLPLPDVVYNRIPYREDEMKDYVQSALKKLKAISGLHLYNNHFFNKWNLYHSLGQNSFVSSYVPETRQLTTSSDLTTMIEKHPLLYLKPISGKAGKGIMSIQTTKGKYILRSRNGEQVVSRATTDLRKLWNAISAKVKEPYVIQQGIELATYEGRPYDIRVLVQKDDFGRWQLSGVGIRVAGKGSITTHVPRGGSIASPEVVLKQSFQSVNYTSFMDNLNKVVLDIAEALEEKYPSLGEMSMDIGASSDGELWFFEANAKPMKFDEPHIRKTSLERIIQYAQFLSNFTGKGVSQHASKANYS
ncbi:YheC/YheD family protein [Ammoniphilus resinae]|uniref:YheC/YheD family protein n=1 Tax=Ammoniphilus resinae TaxID=861532 RepID=A0ABS4GJK7_9BACL|nr:YheC/YheD family protein [Ammoniphilus resinae]MBP1930277.1 hypothetical protein [Ammoniphilus resinae]